MTRTPTHRVYIRGSSGELHYDAALSIESVEATDTGALKVVYQTTGGEWVVSHAETIVAIDEQGPPDEHDADRHAMEQGGMLT